MRMRRKLCRMANDKRGVERWSNLLVTNRILPILRDTFDPSRPPAVNLEINTDCNYKCPFCPQSSIKRPVQYMTMEAFRHVVEELKALDFANSIVLSVNNEPFLHPLLLDFCRIISEELPKALVHLISNGALIERSHFVSLANLSRPPSLAIDDYTPGHVVNMRLREWLAEPGFSKLRVELKPRSWNEKISNRAGNQPGCNTVVADYRDVVCTWPFTGLFLTPELTAFMCCSDYRHEMIVGDLYTQRLMEIWAGAPLNRIRAALLMPDRSKVSLCVKCDAEWFCLPEKS
jgi:hypothetical protein